MLRPQRTIARTAEIAGIGLFTGADVTLRFLPAPEDHGIVFRRVDLAGCPEVPATIDYAIARSRRTAVGRGHAIVEMTEHVLAALAGLRVDNCVVELDAPEPPGCDGSSLVFAEALMNADFVRQDAPRGVFTVEDEEIVLGDDGDAELIAQSSEGDGLTVHYRLDYGPRSPIAPQALSIEITPHTFLEELAFARTFVLQSEIADLKARGYGRRVTARDLLVFSRDGVVENKLRSLDECVRHKILDCVGDFALLGCDLRGHFSAYRSGHSMNREMIRRLSETSPASDNRQTTHAA
jgi:UDP-3-O-[3-hydroxymyristoyl] N-acetylglucosamine deacetylase